MLGVYTSGISGAHINPAVTFANCVFRKFPWRKWPIYALAQILGAMCASGVVYANYKSAIDVFEGGPGIRTVPGYSETASAGIFCTYPAEFMTKTGQFFSEFIASTILMFLIYALKDDGNLGAGNLVPLGLFFVIFGIGACFGWEVSSRKQRSYLDFIFSLDRMLMIQLQQNCRPAMRLILLETLAHD
jgi:aquaglyceroporin related protein